MGGKGDAGKSAANSPRAFVSRDRCVRNIRLSTGNLRCSTAFPSKPAKTAAIPIFAALEVSHLSTQSNNRHSSKLVNVRDGIPQPPLFADTECCQDIPPSQKISAYTVIRNEPSWARLDEFLRCRCPDWFWHFRCVLSSSSWLVAGWRRRCPHARGSCRSTHPSSRRCAGRCGELET